VSHVWDKKTLQNPAKTFFWRTDVFGPKNASYPAKTFFFGERWFSGQKDSPIPA